MGLGELAELVVPLEVGLFFSLPGPEPFPEEVDLEFPVDDALILKGVHVFGLCDLVELSLDMDEHLALIIDGGRDLRLLLDLLLLEVGRIRLLGSLEVFMDLVRRTGYGSGLGGFGAVLGGAFFSSELELLLKGFSIAMELSLYELQHVRVAVGLLEICLGHEVIPLLIVGTEVGKELEEQGAIDHDVGGTGSQVEHVVQQGELDGILLNLIELPRVRILSFVLRHDL